MTPIKVSRLKWKHNDFYYDECRELSNAFSNILDKGAVCSEDIIDEFYNALHDDRMADAKKIIKKLKSGENDINGFMWNYLDNTEDIDE